MVTDARTGNRVRVFFAPFDFLFFAPLREPPLNILSSWPDTRLPSRLSARTGSPTIDWLHLQSAILTKYAN